MGVFVVGMHRSGTSAIAAALDALGLDVGAAERLMKADAANPAGYYEQQEIGDLNDEILVSLGGGWDCLPQLAEGWELEPVMTPYCRRAASIVGTRLAKNRWLIKDPRIAPLLALWRRAVLDRCAAVLIVRDPMEVAWSLALRNGIPILTGLALWSDYNRRALVGLSGLPVYVCSYDELVSAPLATMTSIRASLESWSELSADAPVDAAAARVQPDLRRNTWPRDNVDALEVPAEIDRHVKFLADLAGAHDMFEPGYPPPSPWEQALLVERRTGVVRLRTATTEAAIAVQQRDESARERELLEHRLHARNIEFEAVCKTARIETERLGGAIEARRARLAQVEADLHAVQTRRRDAEKALRSATRRLEALEHSFPVRVARAIKRLRRR